MYPGNLEQTNRLCVHNEALKPYVTRADGWTFVAEGKDPTKPKYGYVATKPGSVLQLQVGRAADAAGGTQPALRRAAPRRADRPLHDARRPTPRPCAPPPPLLQLDTRQVGLKPISTVNLLIAFLKSYEHMGVARIECVSGCQCRPRLVDAHQAQRESTTHLHSLPLSQSGNCTIAVSVTDTSNSGEHKFKVSGLIMQDELSAEMGVRLGDGLWVEGRHHKDSMVG
jgi:hypothetical protein